MSDFLDKGKVGRYNKTRLMLNMSMKLKVTDVVALGQSADFRFVTTAKALDAVPENSVLSDEIIVEGKMENTGGADRLT